LRRAPTWTKDTSYGQTPLWWAAEKGHEVVIKLLIKKGTWSPRIYAMVKLQLEKGDEKLLH
jgi:Ankyrin repeat